MFLPESQIWLSWASEHDFAIVLEELIRVSADRLHMGEMAEAHSQGGQPSEFCLNTNKCVDAGRSHAAEKNARTEAAMEAGQGGKSHDILDSNYEAPCAGNTQHTAEEISMNTGRVKIPRRKSFRPKASEFWPRVSDLGVNGGAFACLSLGGEIGDQTTEQNVEEETHLSRDSGQMNRPKSRRRKYLRAYQGWRRGRRY